MQPLWRTEGKIFENLKAVLPCDPASPPQEIDPKEAKSTQQKDNCPLRLFAAYSK